MDNLELIDKILSKWGLKSESGIIDLNDLKTFNAVLKECDIPESRQTELYESFLKVDLNEITTNDVYVNDVIKLARDYTEWEERFEIVNKDGGEGEHLKESWPIYYIFRNSGNDYYPESKKVIENWYLLIERNKKIIGKLDRILSQPDAKLKLESRYDIIIRFLNRKKYVENATGESTNGTLNNIPNFPNSNLSGFIHGKVDRIQNAIQSLEHGDGKAPTFDVVLLYNGLTFDGLGTNIQNTKISKEDSCLIDVLNNNQALEGKFALVSLKLGVGRVGGVKSALVNIFPKNEGILNEGIVSHIAASINNFYKSFASGVNGVSEKIKHAWDNLRVDISKFAKNMEFIFANGYKYYEIADAKYPELTNLVNQIDAIDESSGPCGQGFIYDPAKAKTDPRGPFRKNFKKYETTCRIDINSALQNISNILNKKQALESAGIVLNLIELEQFKNISNKYVRDISTTYTKIENMECIPRKDVDFITAFDANIKSIEMINLLLNKITENTTDSSKIKKNYLDISRFLSSAAIYGSNENFPLIKIEKGIIKKLGNKKTYEEKTFIADIDTNFKLGMLKIQRPEKSDDVESKHLVIIFFIFFGIDADNEKPVPIYVKMELRRNKESQFGNKVELAKTFPYDKVFK